MESGEVTYFRQHKALDLSHAVWYARCLIGNEPFTGRFCTSLKAKDSLRDSVTLDALHEQAIVHPLSHDELIQLQRIAAQARVNIDLGRQGYDLACAA